MKLKTKLIIGVIAFGILSDGSGCSKSDVENVIKDIVPSTEFADYTDQLEALVDVAGSEWATVGKHDDTSTVCVTFIDVGQGDSILIEDDDEVMLIDTGAYEGYDNLKDVLQEKEITGIDVLVLTHPDADHIQNADEVIKDFGVDKIYMPDIKKDTWSYENLMNAVVRYNVPIVEPVAGTEIVFGTATYEILGPVYSDSSIYEDANSYSIVLKVVNGEDSFLFTGDATGYEMSDIIAAGHDLSADVLKASHHGSANGGCNDETLFDIVEPESVVISCGLYNDHGHPHVETMQLIQKYECTLYRTDLQGTIECISTGDGIEWLQDNSTNYKNGNSL